jgi:hypothetical protein
MKNKLITIVEFLNQYPKPVGPGESAWFRTRNKQYGIQLYNDLKKLGVKEWYVSNNDQYVDYFLFDIDMQNISLKLICELNKFYCDEMSVIEYENKLLLKLWWD